MTFKIQHNYLTALVITLLLTGCVADDKTEEGVSRSEGAQIFFDDFSYSALDEFHDNEWTIRTETGHPGIPGAKWWTEGVSFHNDMEAAQNGTLRLTSETDGTGENTRHTQICHARKYREGTYGARVFFRDEPTFGPDGDEVIQTFYAISPLKAPMDLDYSEADFEYLPNGGWGFSKIPSIWATSWETFQLEPWTKVNEFTRLEGSFAGWHTLVKTISDNKIRYFVDGQLLAEHSEQVYPEVPMSMNFNLWFMPAGADDSEGPVASTELRQYQQDIDWVFHQTGVALTTEQVESKVMQLRQKEVAFIDEVESSGLASPCGL